MKQITSKSGYKETNVTFDILGNPKSSSNSDYIPSDAEYSTLMEVFPWLIDVGKRMRTDRAFGRINV